ncbi:glycosyltransferase family 4 protein [Kaistella anthropi]|nr:glycosyltransferase family 4 protein [Kaistella anthropi]
MKLFRISTIPLSLNILLKGQLSFLSQYFDVTAVSGAGKDLDEVAKREEVKVHPIQMERQVALFKDLVSLWKLYRYFKKEKPDIIHSITPKAGLLSMIAGKWAGVPVRMHTFTGLVFPYKRGVFRHILIMMDRLLCLHATHVYPEGKGVKEDLERFRITKKPLKIIANGNVNGVDLMYFNPHSLSHSDLNTLKQELGITPNDFVFIFVGRLVGDKGINELVTAFNNLTDQTEAISELHTSSDKSVKLLLVGPLEQDIDPLAPETLAAIENHPQIISVGFQQDVRPYFAISDALVFPSYREGFPNVVMQAGAMELPAIVTDINGCNEIIEEGKNGMIIPVKDVAALQSAMKELISNPALYATMKQSARPHIERLYRQEVVWDALLKEYRELLAEK